MCVTLVLVLLNVRTDCLGIKYEDLAYTSSHGFAAVGSNNGKNGTDGLPFFNKPETVIDFAWRS